ncbi:MAG: hypothetical protein AAGI91_15500 [Bacteroidota bacterium]
MRCAGLPVLFLLATSAALAAQPAGGLPADTLFAWQTYGQEAQVRVQTFASDDDRRPHTVVVDELASNRDLVTDDVRYFVDTLGRSLGLDPTGATFVFRFSGRSFHADAGRGKTLLLRATFSRTKSGALGAPAWRLLTRDELADLTDRALY